MSIAFERSTPPNSVHRSAFIPEMPSFFGPFQGDRRFPLPEDEDDDDGSSSVGRNSDLSSDGEDSGDDCARSFYKGGPLDSMAALEEVLPIKRGMSKFYSGKSKSFTSLADASSIEDLVKPENPYTKKRNNLLSRGNFKNHVGPPKENTSKKPPQGGGFLINCHKSSNIKEEECESRSASSRPPLHPPPKPSLVNGSCSRNSPCRSFSLWDLHAAAGNCND